MLNIGTLRYKKKKNFISKKRKIIKDEYIEKIQKGSKNKDKSQRNSGKFESMINST